jgi:hypothetical protein
MNPHNNRERLIIILITLGIRIRKMIRVGLLTLADANSWPNKRRSELEQTRTRPLGAV